MNAKRPRDLHLNPVLSTSSAASSDRVLRSKTSSSLITQSNSIPHALIIDTRKEDSTKEDDNVFLSCLLEEEPPRSPGFQSRSPTVMLRRALSFQELDDKCWLSSSFINLVLSKFARHYGDVHFMSIDFVVLSISSNSICDVEQTTDIVGDKVADNKPIVLIYNAQNIHWNLIRIIRHPKPELQLFEPMGKPSSRHSGISYRNVPRNIVAWLDKCYPLPGGGSKRSWIDVGVSAITSQQQMTSFDCGVACLLYAEKAALGQSKELINEGTTQQQITDYRHILQDFTHKETGGIYQHE